MIVDNEEVEFYINKDEDRGGKLYASEVTGRCSIIYNDDLIIILLNDMIGFVGVNGAKLMGAQRNFEGDDRVPREVIVIL